MCRMTWLAGLVMALSVAGAGSPDARAGEVDVADSIVKVIVAAQQPRYAEPWTPGWSSNRYGSGFVVSGQRILTAAHVIVHQTLVRVQKYGSAEKCPARVLFVSHEADLTLLTVDDPTFFEGMRPLELGDLPSKQQEVTVLGFPTGGEALSITKGVVSRVEHQMSAHSAAGSSPRGAPPADRRPEGPGPRGAPTSVPCRAWGALLIFPRLHEVTS